MRFYCFTDVLNGVDKVSWETQKTVHSRGRNQLAFTMVSRRNVFFLVLLLLQNTSLSLLIKASKNHKGDKYVDSTVVFLNELLKFICCFFLFWNEKRVNPVFTFGRELLKEHNLPFVVPCFIYAIQVFQTNISPFLLYQNSL
jgi:hypothetical protein